MIIQQMYTEANKSLPTVICVFKELFEFDEQKR